MFLVNRRIKGVFVKTPYLIDNNTIILTNEQYKDLLIKSRQTKNKESLMLHHMNMTIAIATRYASRIPLSLRDDIFSVAIIGLGLALDRVPLTHDAPQQYINTTIHGYIDHYINRETRFNKYKNIDDYDCSKNGDNYDETNDIKKLITDSSLERVILDLRLQDYSDPEIAEILSISKVYVGQIREKIGKRYLRIK